MQIHTFMNTVEKMESKQRFVSPIKYYEYFILDILHTYVVCLCSVRLYGDLYNKMQRKINRSIKIFNCSVISIINIVNFLFKLRWHTM